MPRPSSGSLLALFAASALAASAGCGGGGGGGGGGAVTLQSIAVAPGTVSLPVGRTQAFTATGHYSDATTQDLTSTVTWSAEGAAATIGADGVATATATGTATVKATSGTVQGTASFEVTAAVIDAIAVANATVAVGADVTLSATGTYSDGSVQDVSALVAWAVGDGTTATVSGDVAHGVAAGQTSITATSGLVSSTGQLTVTAAALESIAVTPATASVAAGRTVQLTATATFVGGATQDVTASVNWSSSDATVATVDASGLAAGVAPNASPVTITARWGGQTATASLTVSAAVLDAIDVTPPAPVVAAGFSQQLRATAVYSDGSKVDVTADSGATWSSASAGVVTVSAAGLATAGSTPGTATITVDYGGASGTAAFTATSATLTQIAVSPADPVVPLGVPQAFAATGVYSDGTKLDLTTQVTWTSSDTGIATISAAGVATPVAAGASPITITAAHGGVSGNTTLTVTSATLTEIAVTPAAATIAAGTTVALAATGVYSDGSTQDLTALVAWSSGDPAATVSNGAGTEGRVKGVSAGLARVTATLTASSGTFSDYADVTVTSATLTTLAIAPADSKLPAGLTEQLAATGQFSDGSTQDLTLDVGWVSSDPSIAGVSNAPGEEGLATAVAPGAVTVSASYGTVTATTGLTVSNATIQSITVTPATASVPKGYKLQFSAQAHYTDGSVVDVTRNATWSSSNVSVATVSNAAGSQGLATGAAAGSATITATLNGKAGTATLSVVNTTLKTIAVSPATFSVAVKGTSQLTATATFQNGTVLDVTTQVSWSSSARKTATVSKTGLVTGVAAGSVTIKASKTGKSGTASGTVTP